MKRPIEPPGLGYHEDGGMIPQQTLADIYGQIRLSEDFSSSLRLITDSQLFVNQASSRRDTSSGCGRAGTAGLA
jgi:hypothetical protein